MTTTYGFVLPPVESAFITYAGCGSHTLQVQVHVEGEFNLDDFIRDTLKVLREVCHHKPIDGYDPYDILPGDLKYLLCRHCDSRIVPGGPDADGRQSWILL